MAENYRNTRSYENLERRIFDGVGAYDIPPIAPINYDGGCEFIGFNNAKTCKHPEDKGVHFFLDDYQFNRLWTNIDRYIPMLSQFRYVMAPDFLSSIKWDYRGYTQAVDKIESAVKSANTESKRQRAYRAIINQDRNITAELNRIANGGGDAGDTRVLMKERRRLRQLKAKLTRG